VRQFSATIWGDAKHALARYAERKETDRRARRAGAHEARHAVLGDAS
jgi:hypothetical protein